MDIGTYVAEKHILDDGVLSIEIHGYAELRSGELIFSIDANGNIVISDVVRDLVSNESLPAQP